MLQAIPKALFSRGFIIRDGAQDVAEIDRSWWAERGMLTANGTTYQVSREGVIFGDFLLETDGAIQVRAVMKMGWFRSSIHFEYAGKRYSLASSGHGAQFLGGLGEKIGTVSRDRIDLPAELPLAVRIFVFWMALFLWSQESD
jgi:hypothetical protein